MRLIRINYKIGRRISHRKPKNRKLHSRDIDKFLLMRFTVLNELTHKTNSSELFSYENGINYISAKYVELLRNNIIKIYEKSEDPVVRGDLQRSNLEFCLDYVKSMYESEDIKSRNRKIIYKAAFILFHLNIKHAFLDGNKRTSLVTCNSFLEYNGFTLMLPFKASNEFILELAKGNRSEQDCRHFILKYVHKLRLHKSCKKKMLNLSKLINTSKGKKV